MKDPYVELASAIVEQAAKDYRQARRKLIKSPEDRGARLMVWDCERFFHSGWFAVLTDLDGEVLFIKLKEEFQ